jgi:ATP-binding cassette subfamily B protein
MTITPLPSPEAGLQPAMSEHMTALRCLFLLAMHHGYQLTPEQLATAWPGEPLKAMASVLRMAGLHSRVLRLQDWNDLISYGSAYPVLAQQKSGHWLIVAGPLCGPGQEQVAVLDPAREHFGVAFVSKEAFSQTWSGTAVLCKRKTRSLEKTTPFGMSWFVREFLRHRTWLRDVIIAALSSSILALATPLLYHVIIDKVIPNRASSTLLTVVVIFLVATVADSAFVYVRQRLMLFVTNKMDAHLGSQVFAKLLSLPMPFFEHVAAGVLTRHVQQTEKLRHFLTGRLFQTALDCMSLPILAALLVSYSVELSLVVLCFAAAIAGVVGGLIPAFRARLNQLYAIEAGRQAQLVETIHGIRTIKSLAMEHVRQDAWNTTLATSVRGHSVVGRISAAANAATGCLDRLMQITILGLGSQAVFDGELSIGGLVAFTMLATRVSGPLLQIVGLINEYQEIALSQQMLASVMDHPGERDGRTHAISPVIKGQLVLDCVTFRYEKATAPALDRVSFEVREGEVVGVVGRSGSGKTTLIRLIQGIQAAQAGVIKLDGGDIRSFDLSHLRRNMGVVLQDSFLFRGTIRENIAAANPSARLSDIIAAAQLAGADEFIDRLPLAYETVIEEGAVNFSGGQRQRISIARTLLTRPRFLIFDEATSALDPESEAVLQANLREIAHGRTMMIVSHRLSSLVQADRILVLDRGRVADFAPHGVLVERCAPYRSLWQQQTNHLRAA